MHTKWLEFLRDPETHGILRLEVFESDGAIIREGMLTCDDRRYPIVNGIPRFAGFRGQNYADSFGWQWHHWPRVQFESENAGRPMAGHTTRMFERITGQQASLDGQTVVDVGCGPGRFLEVLRAKGACAIGVDFSGAVEAARANFPDDDKVLIIQADALRLPLAQGVADGAFSIGVLHHTPDPSRGVTEIARVTRAGGWGSVCVYPKGSYYDFPTVQFWRRTFKALWPVLGPRPALLYAWATSYGLRWTADIPLVGKALRVVFPYVRLPDRRWSLLDTFDSVTPSHQSAHEAYEVFRWMIEAGFEKVEPGNWGFTAWHGLKTTASDSDASSPG